MCYHLGSIEEVFFLGQKIEFFFGDKKLEKKFQVFFWDKFFQTSDQNYSVWCGVQVVGVCLCVCLSVLVCVYACIRVYMLQCNVCI